MDTGHPSEKPTAAYRESRGGYVELPGGRLEPDIKLEAVYECTCGWACRAERSKAPSKCPWCEEYDTIEEGLRPVCQNCGEMVSAFTYQHPKLHNCVVRVTKLEPKGEML